jgi:Ca2+-binding RTX toxin-like protein
MAAFIATKAVDMGDLSELGLLSDFKQLKTPSVTDLSSFTATKGQVSLFITGSHMTAVLKSPSSGTMDGIQVSVGGKVQYAVNNLGLPFGQTQKTFKGDFESTLFKGADVITGSDAGDKLNGYGGDDTISGRGGADVIAGSGSDDTINGGADNDIINGNAGADIVDGGAGSDMLSGGGGRDTFLFDNKLNGSNIGTITDFTPGKDEFHLSAQSFKGIGKPGVLPSKGFVLSTDYKGQDDVVVYFKATGKLAYEADGGNLGNAIQFAKVTARTDLDSSDFFIV